MSDDLYDDDILWWSEQQAELLRRVVADQVNGDNVVEEIESAGPTDPLCRQAGIDLDGEGETP